jgi:hypothetical protein
MMGHVRGGRIAFETPLSSRLTGWAAGDRDAMGSVGRMSRVFLITAGDGIGPGSAITDGMRLLGIVARVSADTAIVRRFGHPGQLWPVLFQQKSGQPPLRLLLRSRGWDGPSCVFELVFSELTPVKNATGIALTGAVSSHCPRGLLLGAMRFVGDRVEIDVGSVDVDGLPRGLHALQAKEGE